jgi:hypothetical protein
MGDVAVGVGVGVLVGVEVQVAVGVDVLVGVAVGVGVRVGVGVCVAVGVAVGVGVTVGTLRTWTEIEAVIDPSTLSAVPVTVAVPGVVPAVSVDIATPLASVVVWTTSSVPRFVAKTTVWSGRAWPLPSFTTAVMRLVLLPSAMMLAGSAVRRMLAGAPDMKMWVVASALALLASRLPA